MDMTATEHAARIGAFGIIAYSFDYEMTIESSAESVWPKMINYHEWNPEHLGAKVQKIKGEGNSEGEIILESKRTAEGFEAPVVIETVKVVPNRQIVWALYSPTTGASEGIGFVEFSLNEVGESTLFTYRCYGWFKGEPVNSAQAREFNKSVIARLDKIFPPLKAQFS